MLIWISDCEPLVILQCEFLEISSSWEGSDLAADRNSVNYCRGIQFWINWLNIFPAVVSHSPWHLHILRKFQGLGVFWYASALNCILCEKLYFLPKLFMLSSKPLSCPQQTEERTKSGTHTSHPTTVKLCLFFLRGAQMWFLSRGKEEG